MLALKVVMAYHEFYAILWNSHMILQMRNRGLIMLDKIHHLQSKPSVVIAADSIFADMDMLRFDKMYIINT